MEDVVQRIQEYMEHTGHNATSLAKAIGMNRPTLVHILNGRNKPNLQLLQQLALFDSELDVRYLLTGIKSIQVVEQNIQHTESTPSPTQPKKVETKTNEKLLVLNPNGTWNTYTKEA